MKTASALQDFTPYEDEKDGGESVSYRPLTLDDFLEPEEGDVYMEGSLHEKDIVSLKSIFRSHLKNRKDITVFSNLKMEWGIGNLENPRRISASSEMWKIRKNRGGLFLFPKKA
ncbi:MAG: hypothetical protein GY749_19020 [Desulfobacteraceae bacterium]|nr:hypothetical protein [Desulfobacteraceae bacterium]